MSSSSSSDRVAPLYTIFARLWTLPAFSHLPPSYQFDQLARALTQEDSALAVELRQWPLQRQLDLIDDLTAQMRTNSAATRSDQRTVMESPGIALRVLIVEDDASQRKVLGRWLVEWKYQVQSADSATAALEAMMAEPADIMLCDIKMPGHDGLWLAERVRAKWPRTAVIMATGVMELDAVEKARQIGAVDYVTKPFGIEMLRQALDRAEATLRKAATEG